MISSSISSLNASSGLLDLDLAWERGSLATRIYPSGSFSRKRRHDRLYAMLLEVGPHLGDEVAFESLSREALGLPLITG